MSISYRMAAKNDTDELVQFWSENSGWDVIDRAEWERRFTNTPSGDAAVAVAVDDDTGKIIGQFVFIPLRIAVKGKEVKAYRPFAPVLEQSLQTKFGIASLLTGQHPILRMYKKVADDLTRQGVSLIYILPDPRWSRVLQAFPFVMTHKFPLWSYSLSSPGAFELTEGVSAEKINPSDPAVDLLWQKAAAVYNPAIVRNSHTLPWKTSHGDFKVYTVNYCNETIGMFAAVYKIKDHQWLICDVVTKDKNESLALTLKTACYIIQQENKKLSASETSKNKIAILATPPIEDIVKEMGFAKENYHFTLAVQMLAKNGIDKKDVSPANWYVSAND
jgi:hypothetical protein